MRLKEDTWRRTKTGYSWRNSEDNMSGHTVDDLNKKQIDKAENLYEKIFILIRDEITSSCEYLSMVNEIDRLTLCQILAGSLAENEKLAFKGRK